MAELRLVNTQSHAQTSQLLPPPPSQGQESLIGHYELILYTIIITPGHYYCRYQCQYHYQCWALVHIFHNALTEHVVSGHMTYRVEISQQGMASR